jgi:transmembrane 9 superfamily protein 2/4
MGFFSLIKLFLNIFQLSIFKDNENLILSQGDIINIQAGSLSSKIAIIPFGYNQLKICNPHKDEKIYTFGEILTGEEFFSTDYFANTNVNKTCERICSNSFSNESVNSLKKLIKREYYTNWYIDNLPAGFISYDSLNNKYSINYYQGIPLGYFNKTNKKYYIYNHLRFHILINKISDNNYNIVGFNILPLSINYFNDNDKICSISEENIGRYYESDEISKQELLAGNITFKYDVVFELSDIKLQSRWDIYKKSNKKFRWAGLIYSYLLIIILSTITFLIFSKNVQNEIDIYNFRVAHIESIDEFNWKQLYGDVFRPPNKLPTLLAAFTGTGFQLFLMVLFTSIITFFSFMSQSNKLNLINSIIISFLILGFPGGYISAKLYRFFGYENWVKISLITSLFFPGIIILIHTIINTTLIIEKSNAAMKIKDILSLYCFWIFLYIPTSLIGSFLAIKEKKYQDYPINTIPTLIPKKPFYLSIKFSPIITGLICFGAIFYELNSVMNSLWKNETYFFATFLWISFIVFLIVNCEITILVIYWNLTKGDYKWWWKSYYIGGSPMIYLLIYSIYYLFSLKITRISALIIYCGIMYIIYFVGYIICGSLATLTCFLFLRKLYKQIKID